MGWDFPRERNIFDIPTEGFIGRDGLLEGGIPLHRLRNSNCNRSEVGIDARGIFHCQVLCQVGDTVLRLLTIESGEGEDMAGSIPVAVDGHEDGLSFVSLHLEDQVTERCPIIGGTGNGEI